VRIEGYRPDIDAILPYADMLIHPSFEDGMGVVVIEACACGIPVIASRVGGIADIVQDGLSGYLVKPGDSINLARHIVALLDDHDQARHFGRTGREIVMEKFSIERMVNAHRDIYRSI
jgi:glycosyltransferase involved in cell wall biosynthesis